MNVFMDNLEFFSQCGQDKFLYENYFHSKTGGIFLDIGASDGISMSNTYFFEKYLGWSGICVEPHPKYFEKLKNNRSCKIYNLAITSKIEQVEFTCLDGYTSTLSGITKNYDSRHLQRISNEIRDFGGKKETFKINTNTISNLLTENSIANIDLMSLDVEGSELEILETIDFTNCKISFIDVENNYNDKKIHDLLVFNGYEQIMNFLNFDYIYKRKS